MFHLTCVGQKKQTFVPLLAYMYVPGTSLKKCYYTNLRVSEFLLSKRCLQLRNSDEEEIKVPTFCMRRFVAICPYQLKLWHEQMAAMTSKSPQCTS